MVKESNKISSDISGQGGRRPGAGRPAGAKNKKTQAVIDAAKEKGELPLEFMLRVMRDKSKPFDLRSDMAKSAAPYLHARLSSVEVNANVTSHEKTLDDLE